MTSEDLYFILDAMAKNLVVKEISAEYCNLYLRNEDHWMPILEAV